MKLDEDEGVRKLQAYSHVLRLLGAMIPWFPLRRRVSQSVFIGSGLVLRARTIWDTYSSISQVVTKK